MRRLLWIITVVCLFTLVSPLLAQESTLPPDMQNALDRAEEAAQRAEQAATITDIRAAHAADMLGIFESVGLIVAVLDILITVLAVVGGFVGLSRLASAQSELAAARERFVQEFSEMRDRYESLVAEKEAELNQMRQQLERNADQANLALSLLSVGESQYKSQDFAGAIDIYERALQLDADNPIIHYRLGYVYTQSGGLEQARQSLTRALEIEPDFPPALAALGYVYRRIGEKMSAGIERDMMLNQAESKLLDALNRSPKLVDEDGESWWGSLGGLYRRRGQTEEAIEAYRQAAKVTPKSSYAFSNLALLYMQQNNRDAMTEMYRRVEQLAGGEAQADVDNYWAYADLITSKLALSKFHEVDTVLASVFQTVPPDSPYALELLVDTLGRLAAVSPTETASRIQQVIERIQAHIAATKQTAEPTQ
jgi:tetratricopeptide (TPR) repeat protein